MLGLRIHVLGENRPALPGTVLRFAAYNGMSANNYLEMAEHYRRAKEATRDDFTRRYLEHMERSYRVLARSGAVLEDSKSVQAEPGESLPGKPPGVT
ncbi:hypothetical protein ACQPTN_24125 [Bradyrhizobium sp. 13971]